MCVIVCGFDEGQLKGIGDAMATRHFHNSMHTHVGTGLPVLVGVIAADGLRDEVAVAEGLLVELPDAVAGARVTVAVVVNAGVGIAEPDAEIVAVTAAVDVSAAVRVTAGVAVGVLAGVLVDECDCDRVEVRVAGGEAVIVPVAE